MLLSRDCDWEMLICDIRRSLFDRERVATHESDSRWNEEKQCLIRFLNLSRLINRVLRRLAKELYLDQASWTLVFLLSSSTDVTHFEGSVAWYPPRTAPKNTVSTTLTILFLCNQLCSPSLVLPFLYWPGLSFFFVFSSFFMSCLDLPCLFSFFPCLLCFSLSGLVLSLIAFYRVYPRVRLISTNDAKRNNTKRYEE